MHARWLPIINPRCRCVFAADEEHLAACLQPPGELLTSPAAGQPRALQHSTTDSLLQLHHQHHQQQQQQGSSGQGRRGGQLGQPVVGGGGAEGRRRVTLGDPSADAAGGLLVRPGGLQHSMSERPGSRGGGRSGPGVSVCLCVLCVMCTEWMCVCGHSDLQRQSAGRCSVDHGSRLTPSPVQSRPAAEALTCCAVAQHFTCLTA